MQHSDVISIIGGGPSARNIDLAALHGTIIGVNDAGLLAPRVDIILSMDRLWMENRLPDLRRRELPTFLRRSAMHNVTELLNYIWVTPFLCQHDTAEFGDSLSALNGPNSGHCALNLAYVMRPKRIDLVGFDMGRNAKRESYWYKAYKWSKPGGGTSDKRYAEWGKALDRGIEQCAAVGIDVVRRAA